MAESSENWAQQLDELQALSAIFEGDFEVVEAAGVDADDTSADGLFEAAQPSGGWALRCELAVRVDLPSEAGLLIQLGRDADAAQGSGGGSPDAGEAVAPQGAGRGCFSVAHLPPIMLRFALGPGYPSAQPPELELSALWLSAPQVAELAAQLETLWEGQGPGAAVVFTWAEWLRSSALQHIGADDALTLRPVAAEAGDDGGEPPGEGQLLSLLRFSAAREMVLFQAAMHACGVCLEERRGACFVRFDCGHRYCGDCVGQQALVHVADGSLDALRCPTAGCRQPLGPHTLRRVLPAEAYERWEALTLQRTLDMMPDAAYCPRCSAVGLEDPEDNCAQCPKCCYVYCTLCNDARHPGVRCVSADTRLAMLRRKAEGGGAAAVEQLRRKEQELLSEKEVERSSKPCPACGAAIQRSGGCNKMTCPNCSAFMCWGCGKRITGYDHFRDGGDCILFDESEVLRWERRWEDEVQRHAAAQFRNDYLGEFGGALVAEAAGGAGGAQPLQSVSCPRCGQRNFKLGLNNHMQCWSCTRHFCAVCRAALGGTNTSRKGGKHFGPGGCKQHS